MKKISLIIIILSSSICFSQKKVTADKFIDIVGTKYFITQKELAKF